MPMTSKLVLSLAIVAAVLGAAPSEAARRSAGIVTACSRYGNGCYTAPVRKSRFGYEMRLKGGTWIDCRGDCRETLREETVDFWDEQNWKAKIFLP